MLQKLEVSGDLSWDLELAGEDSLQPHADFTYIGQLSEPAVLHNLRLRAEEMPPPVYTGLQRMLVALNPGTDVPDTVHSADVVAK